VKVWENSKKLWKHLPFLVIPNFFFYFLSISLKEFSYLFAMKLLFLFISAAIIVMYPADSFIFKEGWKGEEMFVLVRGQ